ncbi:PRC-barrel domain protein [Gordonibacter sp. An230]|uniref:PRC-barrel domain-containing protein n=1 Tax=Gordonibacter sp. An230 TaxID=1965592 RepID=UPI000B38B43E|nr:PRC-barrel domain-containing protein [Gordonibacter sp. An230]OUO91132.1 PRC-barrel domain protein [Gordonibacter sp. An230]
MASTLITTDELVGVRVVGGKSGQKRIGKVRHFVFHPKEKRCIGFIVKRPDFLWMFRRKDKFVSIKGYDLVDGRVAVRDVPEATDRAACKALGVNWDDCVLWVGLPVMTEDGQSFGTVGNVVFDRRTGAVESFSTDGGATANALLGTRTVPADLVKGFRRGMGAAVAPTGQEGVRTDDVTLGAIFVSDEVKALASEGGMAEKAGAATAVAVDKVRTTVDKARPVASEVARKTGEVVNKGAYATGKQIAATKGMFSSFKEEYDKARGPKPAKEGQALEKAGGASKGAANPASKGDGKQTTAKKSAAKKPAPKKNMFAAFKEEYDKARHDD